MLDEICSCEHSPNGELGVIKQSEKIARIVFNPRHLSKQGGLKPSVFPLSHIQKAGLSLMRVDHLSLCDFKGRSADVVAQMAGQAVEGAIITTASCIRSLKDSDNIRTVCLFDDPVVGNQHIPDNDAHALCISVTECSDDKAQLIQADLLDIFSGIMTLDDAHKE